MSWDISLLHVVEKELEKNPYSLSGILKFVTLQAESSTSVTLSCKEAELQQAQEAQNNYQQTNQQVEAWLDSTEQVLGQISPLSLQISQQQQQVGGWRLHRDVCTYML